MSDDHKRAILMRRAHFVAMAVASAGLAGSAVDCGGQSSSDDSNVSGGTGGTAQPCLSAPAGGGTGGTPQPCLTGGAGGTGGTPQVCLEQPLPDGGLDAPADAPEDSELDGLAPEAGDADSTDG